MPKYRVLEKSVIGNTVYEEGAEVEYDGYPSFNLEPLDDDGKAKVEEFKLVQRGQIEQLIKDNAPVNGMDPSSFADAIGKAIKDMLVAATPAKKAKADTPEVALV